MIDPALLDQLQKADPKTWNKYYGSDLLRWDTADAATARMLKEEAKEAWLQAVLQDAIRARGYAMTMTYNPPRGPEGPFWDVIIWTSWNVWFQEDRSYDAKAGSPAEALLRAYLAAIECV